MNKLNNILGFFEVQSCHKKSKGTFLELKWPNKLKSWPQIILNHQLMSSNTHKNQIQSLSSLSLEQNLRDQRDSQVFVRDARKSSFDLVNIFKDSDQFARKEFKNSLDLLNSNIALNKIEKEMPKQKLQLNEEDRKRIEKAGGQPVQIGEVLSDSQMEEPMESDMNEIKLEPYINQQSENYQLNEYLPLDLAKLLIEKEIPLQYVKGLLLVKDQKEIKTVRRLKVQRYLEKRRNKTWNRKICYNCRQKVAEERLRIKGKFIKKRRAMQILGLTTPTSMPELKRRLQKLLMNKNHQQIDLIIKKEEQDI